MWEIIIPILAAFTVFLIFMVLNHFCTIERRYLNKRLHKFVKQGESEKRIKISWKNILALISKIFAARESSKKLEKKLIRGGVPLKGEEFLTINILSGVILASVVFILTQNLLLALVLGCTGLIIPRTLLNFRIKKRLKRIENQIGDALTTMSNSMRAGFSFLQAMEMISEEMPDPIAGEFKKVLREISMGTPAQKALTAMSDRIGSEDIDLVVTSILIQRQVGGNLAEVLDNISETIRERMRINGEIKTLTAQGKISGMIIGSLPAVMGLLLFIIDSDYIMTLFKHEIGITLVIAGVISQILGYFWIKKVIQIEV